MVFSWCWKKCQG